MFTEKKSTFEKVADIMSTWFKGGLHLGDTSASLLPKPPATCEYLRVAVCFNRSLFPCISHLHVFMSDSHGYVAMQAARQLVCERQ